MIYPRRWTVPSDHVCPECCAQPGVACAGIPTDHRERRLLAYSPPENPHRYVLDLDQHGDPPPWHSRRCPRGCDCITCDGGHDQ